MYLLVNAVVCVCFFFLLVFTLLPFWIKRIITGSCSCRKPCKVGIRYLEDGTKVRISRGQGASESIIPRPEILKIRTTPRPTIGIYLQTFDLQ